MLAAVAQSKLDALPGWEFDAQFNWWTNIRETRKLVYLQYTTGLWCAAFNGKPLQSFDPECPETYTAVGPAMVDVDRVVAALGWGKEACDGT